MTNASAAAPAPPSWRRPIALGAALALALHGGVAAEPLYWVVVYGTFGLSGFAAGLLPAWLARRREPPLPVASGFAVAFIAVGLAMVLLVLATLWHGFTISPATEELWRAALAERGVKAKDVDDFFAMLRSGAGLEIAVLAASFAAFGGGCGGALWVAITGRRARAAAAGPG